MTTYSQRAVFLPRGIAGHAYWRSISPFHAVVFGGVQAGQRNHPDGQIRSRPQTFPTKLVNFANRAKGAGRPSHNAQDLMTVWES